MPTWNTNTKEKEDNKYLGTVNIKQQSFTKQAVFVNVKTMMVFQSPFFLKIKKKKGRGGWKLIWHT